MLSADKLKFLRIHRKLKQRQIADYVGVSLRYVKMVENGKRTLSQEKYDKWIEGIYKIVPDTYWNLKNNKKLKEKLKLEGKGVK